ncbi:TPA: hypothetical protein ACTUXY_003087 [Legionella pneumophila]
MSDYFYEDYLEKESLVLYPYDDPINDTLLIEGYRLGARAIINDIIRNDTFHSGEDSLIYPLINLYTNIIEFSLKKTFFLLKRHYEYGCDYLVEPVESKKIANHSLLLIYREINRILQNKPNPHLFDSSPIEKIIKEFESKGIDSLSSRYHCTKNNVAHDLYNIQLNIRVLKLHSDIEEVVNKFTSYWENIDYQCEE